jgi:hypothetical protein
MGWVDFMYVLADRVLREQRARLENSCSALIAAEGWQVIDVSIALDPLMSLGLVQLGQLRSVWLLLGISYFSDRNDEARSWLADLIVSVALVAQSTGTTPRFVASGLIEFRDGQTVKAVTALAHGRGLMRWARLDAELLGRGKKWPAADRPDAVMVSGVLGERVEITAPEDIVGASSPDDIISPERPIVRITTDEIHAAVGDILPLFHVD